MDIGAAIKRLRLARNLTQEALAERANTSKPNISNLERNAQGFSPVILSSLAKALNVKVSDIFRLAEEIEEVANGAASASNFMQSNPIDEVKELIRLIENLDKKKQLSLLEFLRNWIDSAEP